MRRFVRYSGVLYRLAAALRLVRFVKLMSPGSIAPVSFFLVQREASFYLLKFYMGSFISMDIVGYGTEPVVSHLMDLQVENYLEGTGEEFGVQPATVEATEPSAEDLEHLQWFTDSPYRMTSWPDAEAQEETPIRREAEDFYRLLKPQLENWKSQADWLRIRRHRYWPRFRQQVTSAIRNTYGSELRLYRAIYGEAAKQVLDGGLFPLSTMSSWTISKDFAKDFVLHSTGRGYNPLWVVVSSVFAPEQILFAEVELPEFAPDPHVLVRYFRWENEFVVESTKPALARSEFRIVARTRSKASRET